MCETTTSDKNTYDTTTTNNHNNNMSNDDMDDDPHDIEERFFEQHQRQFDTALEEIHNGRKESCWSWFFLPTPPFIVDGVERGSPMNRKYALRGDVEAEAFLTFQKDDIDLRKNYLAIVKAIQGQLERGVTLTDLVGPMDDAKALSSFRLFERMGVQRDDPELYVLCGTVRELCGETRSSPLPTQSTTKIGTGSPARKKRRLFHSFLRTFCLSKKDSMND